MAITTKSSAGNTILAPLHLPSPSTTGVAMNAQESAYPELWDKHVYSFVPCFFWPGLMFPGIGSSPVMRHQSAKANRQWAWQGSFLENHYEPSPIGPGFYTGPGANITVKQGNPFMVPWRFQDGLSDAPHSFVMCVMLPESSESIRFEYFYTDNPRLTGSQKWAGELITINTATMSLQLWAGDNTTASRDVGNHMVFTNDNFFTEDQWHTSIINMKTWVGPDIEFCRDGLMHTPPGTLNEAGTYTGAPVYGSLNQVRMFDEPSQSENEVACSLFQVFNKTMSEHEMESRTADPLKMFWPAYLEDVVGVEEAAAALREFHVGGYGERDRIAYATP